jgi:hypothetical protein
MVAWVGMGGERSGVVVVVVVAVAVVGVEVENSA